MKGSFLCEYEKELVESAVESAVKKAIDKKNLDFARKLHERNHPPGEILELTGIDISEL